MDQASASSAASCAGNPVAPRTSSSCSQSADQSQTGGPPPARSAPQSEPHAEPSNRDPSPSSPPSADSRLRAIAAGVLLRRSRTIRLLHWGIIAPALTPCSRKQDTKEHVRIIQPVFFGVGYGNVKLP